MSRRRAISVLMTTIAVYTAIVVQLSLFPFFVGPYVITVHLLLIVVLFCSVVHQYELALTIAILYAVLADVLSTQFFGFTFLIVSVGVFVQLALQEFWLRNRAYHTAVLTVAAGLIAAVLLQYIGMRIIGDALWNMRDFYSLALSFGVDFLLIGIVSAVLARVSIQERILFYER